MRPLSLLVIIVLFPKVLVGQETDLSPYPALKIAKETSLYRNDLNWKEICTEYIRIANSSKDEYEKYEFLLNALGDDHGTFRRADNFQIIASYSLPVSNTRARSSKFVNEVLNDMSARFSHKKIGDDIGYLKVVGIGPQYPMEEDAARIQNGIAELKKAGVDKWIVDLRYNGGGNMNPMLSGLSALLGNGNIGGSSDKTGIDIQNYEIRDNKFYDTENLSIDIENPVKEEIKDKVAVLLSRYTVSSGEVVAVAFKGRERTRFFGEKTKGLTTVTGFDRIDDETYMMISKAYYRDRLNNIYTNGVEPDVKIEFKEFGNSDDDRILNESIAWLKK
jgi:C-terminal processing protease CtpA/Prc